MEFSIEWVKELPIEQINKFEDRVIYNSAICTREFTKNSNAYPYLSGELMRSEVAAPIQSLGEKEYGLSAGVDYAMSVWNKTNVKWTNPSTQPKWYYTVFNKHSAEIVHQAFQNALKEI